ncbi:MAG: hypothetical protein EA426_05000, partial [Spirochaetaceae bacterium]
MFRQLGRETTSEEKPLHTSQTFETLSKPDQQTLVSCGISPSEIEEIIVSDITPTGEYGKSYVIRCGTRIVVIADGVVTTSTAISDIAEIFNRDFVGNGVIEFRMNDRRKIEIARYSRTLSDAVDDFIRTTNAAIAGVDPAGAATLDDAEAIEKTSGVRESDTT